MSKIIFKARKSLGQNFLFNNDYLKKIVSVCQINDKSRVIEIGPGYGSLSKLLSNATSRPIISIEKDENLFNWLVSNLSENKINFVLEDAKIINWSEFLKNKSLFCDDDEIVVTGNLPYNISNEIIINLIKERKFFKRFIFLVQKEVAQRWVASPINYKNKYSNFSVFINYFCKTSLLFEIPRKFFNPIPKVDGALVFLEVKETFSSNLEEKKFFTFVKNCFCFRRKTLYNNLKSFWIKDEKIKKVFQNFNFSSKIRPQDLSLENYLILFNEISLEESVKTIHDR